MSFFRSEKRYLPTVHFGDKLAHFTVRSRKLPAVLPSDSDHIRINKRVSILPKPRGWVEAGPSEGGTREGEERVSFRTFVETRMPSLSTPYKPCWWLPTGHLQTAYCVAANFDAVDTVVYKRSEGCILWCFGDRVFTNTWSCLLGHCFVFQMEVPCKHFKLSSALEFLSCLETRFCS